MELKNLIALYSVTLLLNVALSAFFWWQQRTTLHRDLFFAWASTVVTLVIQAGFAESSYFAIAMSFGSGFLVNIALAFFVSNAVKLTVPWRAYVTLWVISIVVALVIHYGTDQPFWAYATPVAIGVALPLLHTVPRVLLLRRKALSSNGFLLTISCALYALHMLDYPFLRDKIEAQSIGFTIAVVIVFALSITTPAVVLENVAEERERAKQLNKLQRRFFADVSHDLRTPLTLILASLGDLLERRGDHEERREIELAQRNAHRLLRLIDEILDLAKADAGGLRLDIDAVDLRALVASVEESSQPLARHKSIELKSVAVAVIDMYGDTHRIESILSNLVGNALKYTPAGGRIEIQLTDLDDGAEISVSDTGAGIGPDELPHIFDRFYQVTSGPRAKAGGVGIGLALAKELAELHDGKLTVQSQAGEGTTFTLWLPKGKDHFREDVVERRNRAEPSQNQKRRSDDRRKRASEDRQATPTPNRPFDAVKTVPVVVEPVVFAGGRRPRVVLAEDQDELREYTAKLIGNEYDVIETRDGQEAWDAILREKPDLVVSDIMMPYVTGGELCALIKGNPLTARTPVILLTARVGSEAAIDAYAHGADDFVAKPFHPRVLMARVRAQLRLRALSLHVISQEKLAAIGTLAAGVAHEVKNPINSIANAARFLSSQKGVKPETTEKFLKIIEDGANRIDGIVGALETHVRPAEAGGGPGPCDLRDGLDATVRLLEHRLGNIEIVRKYGSVRPAMILAGPVNQVFLNLLDNATRSGATRVVLQIADREDRVEVTFSDDGPGVKKEISDRIFDPFFTTRAIGEGTGLGLYLSRKIIEEQGGQLALLNPGRPGAEFLISLPACERSRRFSGVS